MKKYFIFAALALVCASCAKQVPVTNDGPGTQITFSPISQKMGTKAPYYGVQNATYTGAGTDYEDFNAWAYFTAAASGTTNPQTNSTAASGSEFFANVTCGHVAGTNNDYWTPSSETYYWPKDGYLHFHALSPAIFTKTSTAHSWANGFTITGYQAPVYVDNTALAQADDNQIDLLYSDFVFDKKRSDYSATGATVEKYDDETDGGAYVHDGVDLTFRHALSTILFQAKTDVDYKGTRTQQHKFIVRKIEVLNAYNTGTFHENRTDDVDNKYEIEADMTGLIGMHKGNEGGIDTDADTTPDQGTPYWSTFSNEVALTPYDVTAEAAGTGSEATATSGTTQIGQTLIALPQNLAAGTAVQVRVTFEYSFSSDTGSNWSSPFTQTITLNLGGKTGNYNGVDASYAVNNWLINHKYAYTLVFKLDPVIFDPCVEAFVNVNDITVELPQN